MGRPSKLTPSQWRDVEARAAAGESGAVLAREYKVSEAAVSKRISKVSKEVSKAAHKLAEGRLAVSALPSPHQQHQAESLADKLVRMSEHLADAAQAGAETASILQAFALAEARRIDVAAPLTPDGVESIKAISAIGRTANESSAIARDLLAANKDAARAAVEPARFEIVNYAALPQE